jgi:hypothetical protein
MVDDWPIIEFRNRDNSCLESLRLFSVLSEGELSLTDFLDGLGRFSWHHRGAVVHKSLVPLRPDGYIFLVAPNNFSVIAEFFFP